MKSNETATYFYIMHACICLGWTHVRFPESNCKDALTGERDDPRAPGGRRISEWNNLCCHRVGLDLAGHLTAVG